MRDQQAEAGSGSFSEAEEASSWGLWEPDRGLQAPLMLPDQSPALHLSALPLLPPTPAPVLRADEFPKSSECPIRIMRLSRVGGNFGEGKLP